MELSIRNEEVEEMAPKVAEATGESLTDAILHSLEDRLPRLSGRRTEENLVEQILDIARRGGAIADLDTRPADDILGYREDGTIGSW